MSKQQRSPLLLNFILLLTFSMISSGLYSQHTTVTTVQQEVFRGIVMDLSSDEPMQYVTIKNLSNGTEVETGRDGKFNMPAKTDDLLRFSYPGYRTDTLMVVEFEIKRIYLTQSGQHYRLEEIQIEAMTNAQLETELERTKKEGQIVDASINRGGIRLSPTRLFGQAGRQARRRYDALLAEKERRIIDQRFSTTAIQALTPLEGLDLELFMTKYRPDPEFVSKASVEAFNLYIMDSYAEFKKLTRAEKDAMRLPKQDKLR